MRLNGLIFLTFIFCISIFPQKTLTLEDAIKIALQKNINVQKATNNIKTYNATVKSSYGNFLPNLSASGSWGWTRSEDEGGQLNIGGTVIPIPPTTAESRNYSANIGGSWTLFDGLSNFATLSKSQTDLESAELSLHRLKQDIVYQTISSYYDLMNLEKLLEVKTEDVRWNQQNYETIVERNKLGAVTLADVYAQQVQLGNAELALIETQNNYETSKSNFLFFLGLDVLEDYQLKNPIADSLLINQLQLGMGIDENLMSLVNQALQNRSDYKSAELSLKSSYKDITIARSGHFPLLRNSFGYSLRSNKIENLLDSKTYNVGLTLSIPIFTGFSVSERVQFAEVNAKNKEIDLSDLEKSIKQSIQKTYLDLQAAQKRLDVSEKNVKAAEENRRIEEEKYSLGSTTLLNVLIANSNYTNAVSIFINAQYELIKLKSQIEYDLGLLDYSKYK